MAEVKTMVCNKCGIEKKLDNVNFVPNRFCKCGFELICRQCKNKKQKELYHRKKNAAARVQAKPATVQPPADNTAAAPEKRLKAAAPSCLLDLSSEISAQPGMFNDLKKIAAQEMRTIEAQAVYMLRKAVGFRLKALDAKLNLTD